MAGEISNVSGALADALPSPVGSSSNRSGSQRPVAPDSATVAPEVSVSAHDSAMVGLQEDHPAENTFLTAMLEHAQSVILAQNTTLSFERSAEDGRMYIFVKDKQTGEEIYRIPRSYLNNIDPKIWQQHRVDLRI